MEVRDADEMTAAEVAAATEIVSVEHRNRRGDADAGAFVLFSGADKRCTLLIQAAMTTLSLREELHAHETNFVGGEEKEAKESVSSWGRAVSIARHAASSHSGYVAQFSSKEVIGQVPTSYLEEMKWVLEENEEREICRDLQSSVVNGRLTGLPGYLDARNVKQSITLIRAVIMKGDALMQGNKEREIVSYVRLNQLLEVCRSVVNMRQVVLACYFEGGVGGERRKEESSKEGMVTSHWGGSRSKEDKEHDLVSLSSSLEMVSKVVGHVSSEECEKRVNRHVKVTANLTTLSIELELVRRHFQEDQLRYRMMEALLDQSSSVRGVVGGIVQQLENATSFERSRGGGGGGGGGGSSGGSDRTSVSDFEVPSTSVVDLLECAALAKRHPPSSGDVVELVKCVGMVLRARSMFQQSQYNDVVEYLTPSLMRTFPGYGGSDDRDESIEEDDVEQIELHLPLESRRELELMRSHSLFRSLVVTFWRQVQRLDASTVSSDSHDLVSRLTKLTTNHRGQPGRATGEPGAVITSTINTSVLENSIRLLSSSHERLQRMSSDGTGVALDKESVRLRSSFESLLDLRKAMVRRDWDTVRKQIGEIDRIVKKERISRTGVSALGTKHVPLLSCVSFLEGELLLARRECEDRRCRRDLREALAVGAASGTLNEPQYDTVDVSALEEAIRKCSETTSSEGGKSGIGEEEERDGTFGVHTIICRQLLETAQGMLLMRRMLIVDEDDVVALIQGLLGEWPRELHVGEHGHDRDVEVGLP